MEHDPFGGGHKIRADRLQQRNWDQLFLKKRGGVISMKGDISSDRKNTFTYTPDDGFVKAIGNEGSDGLALQNPLPFHFKGS
jgi:hypothetical protein